MVKITFEYCIYEGPFGITTGKDLEEIVEAGSLMQAVFKVVANLPVGIYMVAIRPKGVKAISYQRVVIPDEK